MEQLTAVLIGAGGRGAKTYGDYILKHPTKIKLVAVCDLNEERKNNIREQHKLDEARCFNSYMELYNVKKIADVALICTQDQQHYEPAVKLMELGYDLLLEKPMSNQLEECLLIEEAAKKYNRRVMVCHVLRYSPFFVTLKQLIGQGKVGKMINIEHSENIAFWHYAMSYVRGAWSKEVNSSPIILAKSCHDLDILNWIVDSECMNIASFGSLAYFNKDNAPGETPYFCQDGCDFELQCPWFAPRFFSNNMKFLDQYTDSNESISLENKLLKLKKTPYGRCVFHCDNDVLDHQTTILHYKNGVDVTFTLSAFTYDCARMIRIMGSEAEIIGDMTNNRISVRNFLTGTSEVYNLMSYGDDIHFGGDEKLMDDFVLTMTNKKNEINTSVTASLMSHVMAFAAERARKTNTVVNVEEFLENERIHMREEKKNV